MLYYPAQDLCCQCASVCLRWLWFKAAAGFMCCSYPQQKTQGKGLHIFHVDPCTHPGLPDWEEEVILGELNLSKTMHFIF